MRLKLILAGLLVASVLVFGVGCGNGDVEEKEVEKNKEAEDLKIITSISIVADIVENIVGERGSVDYIVPIGEEPEEYEVVPSDFQKVSEGDVLFVNGYNLETWLEEMAENVTGTPIVPVVEGGPTIPLAEGDNIPDPHLWLDVSLVKEYYVENILDKLKELDPEGKDYYKENANIYIKELKELEHWIKEELTKIDEENRFIITSENCYKYFAAAYGFESEGIWEINSPEEGTPQQISKIVDLVEDNNIPAVFLESTVDPRYMEMVAKETGVELVREVYSDAVGKEGSGVETYKKMMGHNVNTFVEALK